MNRKKTNEEFGEVFDLIIEKAMSFLQIIIFANIVVLIVAQILKAL